MKNTIDLIESFFTSRDNFKDNYKNTDWRVRYGLAVAIGEHGNKDDLAILEKMLDIEESRKNLFNQPAAQFSACTDDTRLSEYIGEVKMKFDKEYDNDTLEQWQCRGRVYQAIFFAISQIGTITSALVEKSLQLIRTFSEYSVVAAACIALRCSKDPQILKTLQSIKGNDFCSELELAKTIKILSK